MLEYLPHGDLNNFLMVSKFNYQCFSLKKLTNSVSIVIIFMLSISRHIKFKKLGDVVYSSSVMTL